ncbi:MAG: ABC transporter permease subunit [Planctomycetota bacterium]
MIAWKTWREARWLTLLYAILLEAGVIVSVLMWPWLRDQAPALAKLAPAQFIRRWVEGITSPDADAAYGAYMALQLFFKGVNVVGLCFAVVFGALLVARERENHTLEFLLARPLSRSRILWARFWVLGTALVVPILLTSWSAIPLSWTIDENLPFGTVTIGAVYNALFCVLFFAVSALFSVRARTQLQVVAVVGAIAVFEVSLYFVQEIRNTSVFRLSDYDVYAPILAGNLGLGRLFVTRGVWLLTASVAAYAIADRCFAKAKL